ncbi:MAG: hypothetical protein GWP14_04550 [Actinobacteria bacterium]|nr:hypothetical protein [Actinomycetota bacterium]
MPVTITENIESRQISAGESAELAFTVRGTDSESVAISELGYAAPLEFLELADRAISIEPVFVDTANPDKSIWTAMVRYTKLTFDDQDEQSPIISFDTSGGTQHITQSISTVGKYPSNAADYGGAIGYDGENVVGVDITQPVLSFSETHEFTPNELTRGFTVNLARRTGTVNYGGFRGFDSGEVLFLGASGDRQDRGDDLIWVITYRFAVSQTRRNFRVGDITVSEKWGWDYMWVRYADEVDDNSKTIIKKPIAVYIEKVYESTNFSGLGIGT